LPKGGMVIVNLGIKAKETKHKEMSNKHA